ncbi:phosphatase PAP2 family protein [Hydrogenophaga sp. OTU3427]|uniref:phosphatase PAP2 family protein n=1 Tax=Hydrogenophaga sp. OTU3427 TaxID=3043856 RepID=UPI00313AFB46
MPRSSALFTPALRAGLVLLLLALSWDLAGQDLALMRWWGDTQGFALRHHPWLEQHLHDGARRLLVLVLVGWLVLLAVGRGPVRAWTRTERLAVGLGALTALLVVNLIKRVSLTSCPWDLAEFGGSAQYVSHWMLGVADGGGAHCFPGGHASSILVFVGAALPLLSGRRATTARGSLLLAALLLGGAALGLVQTLRGAHYPSHTLWTMVICYAANGAVWWWVHAWAARRGTRPARVLPA